MTRILSWNVNGLRAILKKNFHSFLEEYNPDILCLQEVKACSETVRSISIPYPYVTFHCAQKKGYSGTAIFSKTPPLSTHTNCPVDQSIQEGRVIATEFSNFYLVCVYTPNSQSELTRLEYRHKEWDPGFLSYIQSLEAKKPVIVCGDLNAAHEPIDLARPEDNHYSPGFTKEEREGLSNFLNAGFIDTFRYFHPEKAGKYTWWSYRSQARARNVGWRIDYFLASQKLKPHLDSAFILQDVYGSDHAPVGLTLKGCALP